MKRRVNVLFTGGLPPGAREAAQKPPDDGDAEATLRVLAVRRYIQLRQRHWHTANSSSTIYWVVQLGAVGLSLATPLLVIFTSATTFVKALPAAIGAGLAAVSGLTDFRRLAQARRRAAFQLDSEFERYQQSAKPYDSVRDAAASRTLFCERCIAINDEAEKFTFPSGRGGPGHGKWRGLDRWFAGIAQTGSLIVLTESHG